MGCHESGLATIARSYLFDVFNQWSENPQVDMQRFSDVVCKALAFGNFRLLNRLLTQMERILEINALPAVTEAVVEAARESLVIGQV
jgi:hypothetical protein